MASRLPHQEKADGIVISPRALFIVADDYGMGPATSEGIVALAQEGLISAALFQVNSPYAEAAAQCWHAAGRPMLLGWHPCLTLDRPLLPAECVPSLVETDGRFPSLQGFLKRWCLRQFNPCELQAELEAQRQRFIELTGQAPQIAAGHHHIQLFPPMGRIILDLLDRSATPRPYVRRLGEPWRQWLNVRGARVKRTLLHVLGQRFGHLCRRRGFPGNDNFIGLACSSWVKKFDFFTRWLHHAEGQWIELMCHPGYPDSTLAGRDIPEPLAFDPHRPMELRWLQDPALRLACQRSGLRIVHQEDWNLLSKGRKHAA